MKKGPSRHRLGKLKEKLVRFSEAGFDDAVVMIHAGAPGPEKILGLLG